ncbi:MAG: tRNA lysidine(34) synthetase TilS, partial [Firmicutes bacterium]|nr:tRNA lysidine(34) synthetase TilS [Bacillota bacterium]
GIAPVNGRYLRPLLGVSRTDIEEYARAHGVPHAEDPSNEDSRYSRNFIRNEILPLLSERFDGAESSLNRFAALAAADDDYLYSLAQMPICVDGEAFLPDAVFTQAPPLCARSVTAGLKTLLNSGYESKHIGLIRGLYGKQTGRSLNIKDGVRALRVYNGVTLTREKSEQPTDFCIPFRTGNIKVPGGTIQVSSQMTDDKAQMTNNGENKHKPYLSSVICHLLSNEVICHLSSDNNTSLFLDPGKVPPGSLIRFRRDGDVFTKFGGGQKKLAKYLIDIKLDGRKRDTLPLLCCNNEVLAVIGLEISERVKLDEHSKQALKIEFISD